MISPYDQPTPSGHKITMRRDVVGPADAILRYVNETKYLYGDLNRHNGTDLSAVCAQGLPPEGQGMIVGPL